MFGRNLWLLCFWLRRGSVFGSVFAPPSTVDIGLLEIARMIVAGSFDGGSMKTISVNGGSLNGGSLEEGFLDGASLRRRPGKALGEMG